MTAAWQFLETWVLLPALLAVMFGFLVWVVWGYVTGYPAAKKVQAYWRELRDRGNYNSPLIPPEEK
ncbi:MAG: hypothetical protein BIFFINMI_02374 [Phycisphaerae bacterium]|nr:hypothetical protein [Phycisphaerae bacterium]